MRIIYPMWAGPPSRAAANESSRTLTTQNARWSRVTGRQVSSRYRLPTPRAHFQTEAHDCSKPLGSGLTLFRQVVEALDQAMWTGRATPSRHSAATCTFGGGPRGGGGPASGDGVLVVRCGEA